MHASLPPSLHPLPFIPTPYPPPPVSLLVCIIQSCWCSHPFILRPVLLLLLFFLFFSPSNIIHVALSYTSLVVLTFPHQYETQQHFRSATAAAAARWCWPQPPAQRHRQLASNVSRPNVRDGATEILQPPPLPLPSFPYFHFLPMISAIRKAHWVRTLWKHKQWRQQLNTELKGPSLL